MWGEPEDAVSAGDYGNEVRGQEERWWLWLLGCFSSPGWPQGDSIHSSWQVTCSLRKWALLYETHRLSTLARNPASQTTILRHRRLPVEVRSFWGQAEGRQSHGQRTSVSQVPDPVSRHTSLRVEKEVPGQSTASDTGTMVSGCPSARAGWLTSVPARTNPPGQRC